MSDIPVNMKNTIRSLRVKFGYTQEEASKLLKVSEPTLRAWEFDSSGIPYNKILDIAETYNTPVSYIFFGKESTFSELIKKHTT